MTVTLKRGYNGFMIYFSLLVSLFCGPAFAKEAAVFKGESCVRCHQALRVTGGSAKTPSSAPWRKRQVVVVGGGAAGLSAAHFLRDLDVLVLEKEDKVGGHARREYFGAVPYPVAAVYLDEPFGPVKEMIDHLKLNPFQIKNPAETIRFSGQTIPDWLSEEGLTRFAPETQPEMRKFAAAIKDVTRRGLEIPIPEVDKSLIADFDGITFKDYLLKNFGPMAAKIGDMYVKDMFGAGAGDVSALMGLLYSEDMVEKPGMSWPGGLGALSEALHEELGPRVSTGSLVVSARQDEKGAVVEFLKDGRRQEVRADAVIFATHMMVTKRVARDLSPEKRKVMEKVRYSAYVTVALSFSEKVWTQSYSLWSPDSVFTDLTFASQNNSDFPGTGTEAMPGQIAVAYLPLGAQGRKRLESSSDAAILAGVKRDLEKLLPGSTAKLKEARVIRWGHAMPIMGPHYYRDIQPVLARPEKRYFFAGEDVQAPALEGAIISGFDAARDVRAFLAR